MPSLCSIVPTSNEMTCSLLISTMFYFVYRYMLFYLIWRTLHGLHKDISLNFMVAGHTKFSPDWCFGLLKQKFRRTPVSSLEDIVRLTLESTATRLNLAQLVGSESQEVFVPLYDWQTFLGGYFEPLVGIKSLQHFW